MAFWKDEIIFFNNLLKEKKSKGEGQRKFKKMFDDLDTITKLLFFKLKRLYLDEKNFQNFKKENKMPDMLHTYQHIADSSRCWRLLQTNSIYLS